MMKSIRSFRWVVPLFVVWAVCVTGHARADIYVVDGATHGTADTNPGTENRPFKTIQHAVQVAKPGDTVCVMPGEYDERVEVTTSGAEGKPITLRAVPRRSAIVRHSTSEPIISAWKASRLPRPSRRWRCSWQEATVRCWTTTSTT